MNSSVCSLGELTSNFTTSSSLPPPFCWNWRFDNCLFFKFNLDNVPLVAYPDPPSVRPTTGLWESRAVKQGSARYFSSFLLTERSKAPSCFIHQWFNMKPLPPTLLSTIVLAASSVHNMLVWSWKTGRQKYLDNTPILLSHFYLLFNHIFGNLVTKLCVSVMSHNLLFQWVILESLNDVSYSGMENETHSIPCWDEDQCTSILCTLLTCIHFANYCVDHVHVCTVSISLCTQMCTSICLN